MQTWNLQSALRFASTFDLDSLRTFREYISAIPNRKKGTTTYYDFNSIFYLRVKSLSSAIDNEFVKYAIKSDVEVLLITTDEDEQMLVETKAYQNVPFKALEPAYIDQIVSIRGKPATGVELTKVFPKQEKSKQFFDVFCNILFLSLVEKRCSKCPAITTSGVSTAHNAYYHAPPPEPCDKCGRAFTRKSQKMKHARCCGNS